MIKKVKDPMPYTLITPNGKKMSFYLERMAELYKGLYGGNIVRT